MQALIRSAWHGNACSHFLSCQIHSHEPWLGPVQLPLTALQGDRLSAAEALQVKCRAAGFLLEKKLVDLTFKSVYCTFLGIFAHPEK